MPALKRFLAAGLIFWILFAAACAKSDSGADLTDSREKFLGTWNVSETVKNQSYYVTISADASSGTGVYISNFGNAGSGNKVHAVISGSTIALSPADQMMENEWIVNGSGTYSGTNKINWTYTINTGADLLYITAVYSK